MNLSRKFRVPLAAITAAVLLGGAQSWAQQSTSHPPAERNVRSDTGAQTTIPGGAATGAGQAQIDRETTATDTARPLSASRMAWERTHRATRIIGTEVVNREGERLGDIREIVLEPRQGAVTHAVISLGRFPGVRQRFYAVPWKALEFDSGRHVYVMDATRERLRQEGAFTSERWGDIAEAGVEPLQSRPPTGLPGAGPTPQEATEGAGSAARPR
jgi:sporulation protein YlmC with PRC-barrel domain